MQYSSLKQLQVLNNLVKKLMIKVCRVKIICKPVKKREIDIHNKF
jgi:hypothetical protein